MSMKDFIDKILSKNKESTPENPFVQPSNSPLNITIPPSSYSGYQTYNITTNAPSINAQTVVVPTSPAILATTATPNWTFSNTTHDPLVIYGSSNNEIVRLKKDGSVEWAGQTDIDEAAKAFSKTLILSSEIAAGITDRVRSDIRDSVFNDLISIAKDKGTLTADELTYLLEASKIMEKLKAKGNNA